MWGKIIIPMYRLWLNGLYGLYGPWCPLSSKRPINWISLSLKGVDTNSIFCGGCSSWIHKKYSGITGCLKSDASFMCKWYTGQDRPIDGRLMTEVTVGQDTLDMAQPCRTYWCLVEEGPETQSHRRSWLRPPKENLAMGLTETHPSDRKAWSGRLRSVVRLHPYTRD